MCAYYNTLKLKFEPQIWSNVGNGREAESIETRPFKEHFLLHAPDQLMEGGGRRNKPNGSLAVSLMCYCVKAIRNGRLSRFHYIKFAGHNNSSSIICKKGFFIRETRLRRRLDRARGK